jgi:hypothetical protein
MGVKRKDASLGLSYPLAEGTPGFKRTRKRKILNNPRTVVPFYFFQGHLSCFLMISFILMEVFVGIFGSLYLSRL